MKTIVSILILAMLSTGCASTGVNGAPPTTQQVRDESVELMKDATAVAILISKDKPATAKRVYNAASQVKEAAKVDVLLTDLSKLLATVLSQQNNGDDRIAAQMVIDRIFSRVKRQFGIDLNGAVVLPKQLEEIRAFVGAMADAAMETAKPWR